MKKNMTLPGFFKTMTSFTLGAVLCSTGMVHAEDLIKLQLKEAQTSLKDAPKGSPSKTKSVLHKTAHIRGTGSKTVSIRRASHPDALHTSSRSNRSALTDQTKSVFVPVATVAQNSTASTKRKDMLSSKDSGTLAETGSSNSSPGTENLAPLATTNKANLKNETSPSDFNPFRIRLRSYNAMDMNAIEGATGPKVDRELRAEERIDLRYNITKPFSISIMPEFDHTWIGDPNRAQDSSLSGLDQRYSFYMMDTALIVGHEEIWKSDNGYVLSGFLRYDIPTSEYSQKNSSMGTVWADVKLDRKFGKFDLNVEETFYQFLQQYTSSNVIDVSDPAKPLPVQNLAYRLDSMITGSYDFNDMFSLGLGVGLRNQVRYADASTNRDAIEVNYFIMNPEFDVTVNKNLAFALGIWEMPNMTLIDQQAYSPLAAQPENRNEGYLQMTLKF